MSQYRCLERISAILQSSYESNFRSMLGRGQQANPGCSSDTILFLLFFLWGLVQGAKSIFRPLCPLSLSFFASLLLFYSSLFPSLLLSSLPSLTNPPSLSPANCPRLALSDHVLVTSQESSVNTVVSFSCEQGYTLNGERALACLSTSAWNASAPSCTKPTICPKLTLSSHVKASSGNNSVHAVVMFSCEDGYTLDGDKQITCREDGTWSSNPPSCSSGGTSQSQKNDNSSDVGAIVGGVVGGILIILLMVVATAIIFWKMS
ncbi:Sushi, von Willebrand factor type A, EGF and pentraxin domain-containing protein 1 [Geodia barretti]|nr:Sushi, von Willebrand factor type A, EGF and pentraxin domain-containing protein 1 [Geodia barretti]